MTKLMDGSNVSRHGAALVAVFAIALMTLSAWGGAFLLATDDTSAEQTNEPTVITEPIKVSYNGSEWEITQIPSIKEHIYIEDGKLVMNGLNISCNVKELPAIVCGSSSDDDVMLNVVLKGTNSITTNGDCTCAFYSSYATNIKSDEGGTLSISNINTSTGIMCTKPMTISAQISVDISSNGGYGIYIIDIGSGTPQNLILDNCKEVKITGTGGATSVCWGIMAAEVTVKDTKLVIDLKYFNEEIGIYSSGLSIAQSNVNINVNASTGSREMVPAGIVTRGDESPVIDTSTVLIVSNERAVYDVDDMATPVAKPWSIKDFVDVSVKAGDSQETATEVTDQIGEQKCVVIDPLKWTISFDINGAKGDAPESISVVRGESAHLPECGATKDGCTFDGWQIGDKTYKAGDEFTPTEDTKFTAVWKENPSGGDNTPLIIAVVVIVILAIAGAAFYFFYYKPKMLKGTQGQ